MSGYCDDCGTKLWGNACPNCDEEYCIVTHQAEFVEHVPDDWEPKIQASEVRIEQRINGERRK